MRRIALGHAEIAAGDCSGDEECPGLDAVRIDAMARAMQLVDATDADDARSGTLNLCAHGYSIAARSVTSGSRAQFSITVSPSASTAAISRSSVPVTVILSKQDVRALQPLRCAPPGSHAPV